MLQIEVTRTFVEMLEPEWFQPASGAVDPGFSVDPALNCPASFFRYLYREVGRDYHWVDLLAVEDSVIAEHLADPRVSLWIMHRAGVPAGFFRLIRHPDDTVEIRYFGLLPEFVGKGLGGFLLNAAIERAWGAGATSIWLSTCTLDSPVALVNYLRRGFRPFRTEIFHVEAMPDVCRHCSSLSEP